MKEDVLFLLTIKGLGYKSALSKTPHRRSAFQVFKKKSYMENSKQKVIPLHPEPQENDGIGDICKKASLVALSGLVFYPRQILLASTTIMPWIGPRGTAFLALLPFVSGALSTAYHVMCSLPIYTYRLHDDELSEKEKGKLNQIENSNKKNERNSVFVLAIAAGLALLSGFVDMTRKMPNQRHDTLVAMAKANEYLRTQIEGGSVSASQNFTHTIKDHYSWWGRTCEENVTVRAFASLKREITNDVCEGDQATFCKRFIHPLDDGSVEYVGRYHPSNGAPSREKGLIVQVGPRRYFVPIGITTGP